MSIKELTQYRLYCNTEAAWVQTDYRDSVPTVCPNNNTHSIDTGTISIISVFRINTVIPEDDVSAAQNDFQTRGMKFDIPASVGEHYIPFTSPETDLELMLFEVNHGTENIGDYYSFIVAPFTTCGVLTSDANIGDTVLNVNSTVFDYVKKGVIIYDGSNDKLGFCRDLDSGAGTITITDPLLAGLTSGSDIKFGFPRAVNIYISHVSEKKFGERAKNLATFPKDTPVGLFYTNTNGVSKSLSITFDYYF